MSGVENGGSAMGSEASEPAPGSRRKLSWPMLGIYGAGGMAEQVATFAETQLLMFYLTVVCGMSSSVAGVLLGITLVLDGIVQPLVASLSDNNRSRFGRRHIFMAGAALPMAIGVGLLYSIPTALTGWPLVAYAFAVLLTVRVSEAAYNIPYVALGAEMTDDYHDRSLISALRYFFSKVATWIANALAFGVFLKGEAGLSDRSAYAPLGWVCAFIIVLAAVVGTLGTLSARDNLRGAPPGQKFSLAGLFLEVAELFRNRSVRIIFGLVLFFLLSWGVGASLTIYAYKYFWHLSADDILIVQMVGVAGGMLGVVGVTLLRKHVEKRTMVMSGIAAALVAKIVLVPLWLLDSLPVTLLLPALTGTTVLAFAGLSVTIISYQSMMADTADDHELRFGKRREALCYTAITLGGKIALGIAAMIAGFALDLIDFPSGGKGEISVSAQTATDLGILYGPGTAIFGLVALWIAARYRLDRETHRSIVRDLNSADLAERINGD